jgi:signal transduction histidine kinase
MIQSKALSSEPKISAKPSRLVAFANKHPWGAPLFVCGLFLVFFMALLLTTSTDRPVVSETGQIVGLVLASSSAFWCSRHVSKGREQWAWRCLGCGFLVSGIGDGIFAYFAIVYQIDPTPSIYDVISLSVYPLFTVGLLLLPSTPPTPTKQMQVLLDGGIIAGSLLAITIYYIIFPLYLQGASSLLNLFVILAYPVGDAIMLTALIVLLLRGIQPRYRAALFWLILGGMSLIYADSFYAYLNLQHQYVDGMLRVDPFWVAGELMFILAPISLLTQRNTIPHWNWGQKSNKQAPQRKVAMRQILVPYIPAVLLPALLWMNSPHFPDYASYQALEIIVGLVVIFIVLRQILTMHELSIAREDNRLSHELDILKDEFITNVNHELRTPLMTLQNYVEILALRQDDLDPERQKQVVQRIRKTTTSLIGLVQSILDIKFVEQRPEDKTFTAVSLYHSLSQSLNLIETQEIQEKERELHVQISPQLAILGDDIWLQQVLSNLLSNALKYSAPGTALEVTAQIISDANTPIRKRGIKAREIVELKVRDYGFGIPPEQIPLLFHRFVRLSRDLASTIRGNGLGLYLCRTLVEAMGGKIWCESTGVPGEGTTFHVLLPSAPRN